MDIHAKLLSCGKASAPNKRKVVQSYYAPLDDDDDDSDNEVDIGKSIGTYTPIMKRLSGTIVYYQVINDDPLKTLMNFIYRCLR